MILRIRSSPKFDQFPSRARLMRLGTVAIHAGQAGHRSKECPTEFEPPPGNVPATNGKGATWM